jgi:LAO/AO transport system kinase
VDELIEQVRNGRRRVLARLITQVENSEPEAQAAVAALYPHTGRAHVIGITGPPGSGKSTLVNELAKELRRRGLTLGIVAVDPSSPFTGGALLGDRVRMRDLSGDSGVFIRSMASRGNLGGLARTTADVIKVLDAGGFEAILVETVGAGQAEVDIAATAHTTVVIEAPGMGDDIQTNKAGILEVADILVVNKADRPGSEATVKALKFMLHLNPVGTTERHHGKFMEVAAGNQQAETADWQVPVLETVASEGKGIAALADQVLAHKTYLQGSDGWLAHETVRSRREIERLLADRFMAYLRAAVPAGERERWITAVAGRQIDPYTAVEQLFEQVRQRTFQDGVSDVR